MGENTGGVARVNGDATDQGVATGEEKRVEGAVWTLRDKELCRVWSLGGCDKSCISCLDIRGMFKL